MSGKEESNLSDAGDYLDTSNDQKSGSGLDFSYTPNSGEFQVYFRYWNIEILGNPKLAICTIRMAVFTAQDGSQETPRSS